MIYWQLQFNAATKRILFAFYLCYTLLLLFLSLPWFMNLLVLLSSIWAYQHSCKIVSDKPLAISYNNDKWLAVYPKKIVQLELLSDKRLPLLAVLAFRDQEDESKVYGYWIFATDIYTNNSFECGTWRQLMAVLNIQKPSDGSESSMFSFRQPILISNQRKVSGHMTN